MANGDWFQTYTGKIFHPFDPDPELVCIEDIAHALSLLCRFNGHTKEFYSVAQHSIYVAQVFSVLVKGTVYENDDSVHMCALLHDATEAYCGDMIRPIKRGMPVYMQMEADIWEAILKKFDLFNVATKIWQEVKKADDIVLATERRDVLPPGPGRDHKKWFLDEQGIQPDLKHIHPRPPERAEEWFLDIYHSLEPREEREKRL